MNSIICVTEFNEHTVEAAKVAASLARRWGARVVLVRSVDEREQFPFSLRARLVQQDWRRLAAEAQQLRRLGFDFDEEVVRGMPEDGIATFAWKTRARLIVVGCAPTPLLDRWALGCIAEEICDTSWVPVLAVRSAAPFIRWLEGPHSLNMFIGIDPAARDDAVLNRLDELRELGPCAMTAGLVADPEVDHSRSEAAPVAYREHEYWAGHGDAAQQLPNDLTARGIVTRHLEAAHHPAAALIDRAKESGADLLVTTSHPQSDLSLWPRRRLAPDILRHAPMNVLCVPEVDVEPARLASAPLPRSKERASPAGEPTNQSESPPHAQIADAQTRS